MPWPTPVHDTAEPAESTTRPDGLGPIRAVIAELDRRSSVIRCPTDRHLAAGPGANPFRAAVIGDPSNRAIGTAAGSTAEVRAVTHDQAGLPEAGIADLVITSLRPHDSLDSQVADPVALLAARLLRAGGFLVVLTHCDWTGGELVDPTGAVVTAGQHADLLYLQHIVALHLPVRHGRLHTTTGPVEHHESLTPHRRIHSDVLVFAQPHDHRFTTPQPSAGTPTGPGGAR